MRGADLRRGETETKPRVANPPALSLPGFRSAKFWIVWEGREAALVLPEAFSSWRARALLSGGGSAQWLRHDRLREHRALRVLPLGHTRWNAFSCLVPVHEALQTKTGEVLAGACCSRFIARVFPECPTGILFILFFCFCSSQHLFVSKVSSAAPLVTRLTKQSSSDTRLTKACKGRQGFKLELGELRSIFGHLLGHGSRMSTAELRFQPAAAAGVGGQ